MIVQMEPMPVWLVVGKGKVAGDDNDVKSGFLHVALQARHNLTMTRQQALVKSNSKRGDLACKVAIPATVRWRKIHESAPAGWQ